MVQTQVGLLNCLTAGSGVIWERMESTDCAQIKIKSDGPRLGVATSESKQTTRWFVY